MRIEQSEVGRRRYLDGLRGVAACMVFSAHLMIALMPAVVTFNPSEAHFGRFDTALGLSLFGWIWNGEFAVCIFFVLSGFVLSEFASVTKLSFPAMVVRRYFRLALPMLITSFIAYLIMLAGLYKNFDASQVATKSGWLSMWYRAFEPSFFVMAKEALYGAFAEGRAHYNSNLWTMRIELIGSVLVYLVHFLFRNVTARTVVLAIGIWVNLGNFYSLFAAGALLYDHKSRLRSIFERLVRDERLRGDIATFGLVIGFCLGAYPHIHAGMIATSHAFLPTRIPTLGYHMLGAVLTVASLLYSRTGQRLFASSILQWLGRISFVLYLIHLPLICSVAAWLAFGLRGLPYPLNLAITALVTSVVVMAASTLLYRFVDLYTTSFSRFVGKTFDALLPVHGSLGTKSARGSNVRDEDDRRESNQKGFLGLKPAQIEAGL